MRSARFLARRGTEAKEYITRQESPKELSKDAKLFLGFTPEIVSDLRASPNVFLEDVIWSDSSDYGNLLLADHLFVNNRLAEFAINKEPAQNAFIEQLFHQLVKQPVIAYGRDSMNRLRESFVDSDFNMQKLVVGIAAAAALYSQFVAAQRMSRGYTYWLMSGSHIQFDEVKFREDFPSSLSKV